jgi:sterol 3beta-glucosyltransferase
MKITLLTYGSRGDVEPFVALGEGLIERGHHVHLAAPQAFEELATSHGITFTGLPGDPGEAVKKLVDDAGKNWLRMMTTLGKFVLPLAKEVFTNAQQAAGGSDLVIHSFLLTGAGYEIAKRQGVPNLSVQFFPVFSSTGNFPSLTAPELPLGRFYNHSTHKITNAILKFGMKATYRWVQRQNPDLPDLTGWAFDGDAETRTPILYAISPHVVPPPDEMSATAYMTGYWSLKSSVKYEPSPELLGFLEAGAPPVAICFGSTISKNSAKIAKIAHDALMECNVRGILVGKGLHNENLPPNILWQDFVPYEWLFPRVAVIAHHGGAGTTGVALKAGVPNIVIPFASDQPFWGRRIHQLGISPKPIFARKLTVKKLAASINAALSDKAMKENARTLSEKLRHEDGVAHAIEIIEGMSKD